jgi:hypothetical protein
MAYGIVHYFPGGNPCLIAEPTKEESPHVPIQRSIR